MTRRKRGKPWQSIEAAEELRDKIANYFLSDESETDDRSIIDNIIFDWKQKWECFRTTTSRGDSHE